MQNKTRNICYPRKEIITVLQTLNELVVSLDQIGSASDNMTKAEAEAAISDFMGPKMFRKLAQARSVLSAPFSNVLGVDKMDDLEREMQGIQYWNDRKKKRK